MKTAYTLLGVIFLILIAAVVFFAGGNEAQAPTATEPNPNSNNHTTMETITLKSSAFEAGGTIPSKYTCDGENVTPPLSWEGVPEGAQSLALIMDDPDIPQSVKESMGIDVFDHWVVFNIVPSASGVEEGSEPAGTLGSNTAGSAGYTGPCPPDAEHRYVFKLYALDSTLDLPEGAGKADVEAAMEGHVLGQGELIGRYERP